MGFLKEFLKLTRFEHAIMLAIAVFISEIIVLNSIPVFTTAILLSILVPVFSEMGAFSLNDYLDMKTDKLNNRMERPLIKGTISPRFALYFGWLSMLFSVILAFYININAFAIAVIFNILAILYNYELKDLPLLGNAYIGLTMSIPFIFGNFVISENLNSMVLLLAMLAFFAGFGREIVKSVQDMEGDKKARKSKTFPLIFGKKPALILASVSYLLFLILTIYLGTILSNIISLILLAVIILFFLWKIIELVKGKDDKKFLEISRKYSLLALLLGLIAVLIEIIF